MDHGPLEGEILEPSSDEAGAGRDDVIRRAHADGVPMARLADWHGLTVNGVAQIVAATPAVPPSGPGGMHLEVRTASGRRLNPFDPDLPDLDMRRDPQAAVYYQASLSPATRRAYRRYIEVFLDFCALTTRREMPATLFTLEAFAIWLAQRPMTRGRNKGKTGMAPKSIELALSSVRAFHEAQGENLPSTRLARKAVEGHRRMRKADPDIHDGQGSPNVTLPTFVQLVEACDPATNAGLRDRAMLTLGLAIMARRHELVDLDRDSVRPAPRDPGWLEVYVRHTKSGEPRRPKVPPLTSLPAICPVRAITAWQARLDQLGIAGGPLFRAVDQHDNVQGTPGGKWAGRPSSDPHLDPATVESIVLRAAERAQVANAAELRPHGVLRATAATETYNAGADILAIARQGGWGDRSPVVFSYIRDVDEYRRNPMALLDREGGS